MKARLALLASFLGCWVLLTAPACASMAWWRLSLPWSTVPPFFDPAPPHHFSFWSSSGPGSPGVYFDPGSTGSVASLQGGCTGASMSGMSVTFDYLYGGKSYSQTVPWTATTGSAGGAFATGGAILGGAQILSLVESGNTNSGEWILQSAGGVSVENVVVDGLSGNAVFDAGGTKTTPGAGAGKSATCAGFILPGTQVSFTYSDLVMLEGSGGPAGDLYRELEISFSGSPVSSFSFIAGTATVSPLPAPPSLVLISSGLLFLLAVSRRTWTRSG